MDMDFTGRVAIVTGSRKRERWVEVVDRAGEMVPRDGSAQGSHEMQQAITHLQSVRYAG